MIEKIEVPQFGREIRPGVIQMESKEGEIIKLAEKLNEIIDYINSTTPLLDNHPTEE